MCVFGLLYFIYILFINKCTGRKLYCTCIMYNDNKVIELRGRSVCDKDCFRTERGIGRRIRVEGGEDKLISSRADDLV